MMDVNQDKPGIISWWLWKKAMKLRADEDTLYQPLEKWYKLENDLDWTWPTNMYSGHLQIKQHKSRSRLQMGQSHGK
eukprot:9792887-Ditylum_brightwellii.AAC.1